MFLVVSCRFTIFVLLCIVVGIMCGLPNKVPDRWFALSAVWATCIACFADVCIALYATDQTTQPSYAYAYTPLATADLESCAVRDDDRCVERRVTSDDEDMLYVLV